MTARPPCPVCGVPVAVAASGTLAFHRRPVLRRGVPGFAACPGSGALAPAGDLLGAPLAVETHPEPRPLAPHAPAFQLDAFNLDLFGGPQS